MGSDHCLSFYIVISVVFTQNEDLSRNVLKYRIKLRGHISGSKYFGGKLFSFPANFPRTL